MKKRSAKSSLMLMELIVVILFFALCAAICMQVFASARLRSRDARALSGAALAAESAAECVKASRGDLTRVQALLGGDFEGETLIIGYDEQWQQTARNQAPFLLEIEPEGSGARITAARPGDGDALFSLTAKVVSVDG